MKSLRLVVGILMAACIGSAFAAVSAPASFLLAEWLLNGVRLTENDLVEIEGEILLVDLSASVKPDILCSGIYFGWVGPEALGWVSEVLNLDLEPISITPLTVLALLCLVDGTSGCEASTPTVDVYPVGLPWEIEIELLEQVGVFFIVLFFKHGGGRIGWEITNCLVLGLSQTDECTNESNETIAGAAAELTLEGTLLLGSFSEEITLLAGVKLANCTQGGVERGVVEGGGSFDVSLNGELTASSEGAIS